MHYSDVTLNRRSEVAVGGEGPFCRLYTPPRQTRLGVMHTSGKMPLLRYGMMTFDMGPEVFEKEALIRQPQRYGRS